MLRLYAIVGKAPLLARPLVAVSVGAITIVAARCRRAPLVTPAALRAHDRVVRGIEAPAVLPCRFGLVVDEEALADLVRPVAPAIRRALALVRNCVQYTCRVYGEAHAPAKIARGGAGTRWLVARRAANAIPEASFLQRAVASMVRATKTERRERPPLLGSVYHLVRRRDARAYEQARDAALGGVLDVRIETSGPWPAYAFSDLWS